MSVGYAGKSLSIVGEKSRLHSTLTPKGRQLLARAVPVWRRTHIAVEARLPVGDPDRLRENLRAVS